MYVQHQCDQRGAPSCGKQLAAMNSVTLCRVLMPVGVASGSLALPLGNPHSSYKVCVCVCVFMLKHGYYNGSHCSLGAVQLSATILFVLFFCRC